MQIILFILYFLCFGWLITVIPFFKKTGIGKWWLLSLFVIKIAAAFAYGWFFSLPQYADRADTWGFYKDSLPETDWLLRDPIGFIKDLFYDPYQQSGNLFSGINSYWNDLKYNSFIKLTAVINVFTNKSYYTNIIFFNFLYFFGPVALYKLVQPHWRFKKRWLILPTFLLPSFVFWCSGIHKDGLIFSATMLFVYAFQQQLHQRRFLYKHSLLMLFCAVVVFALRNAILLLLLPSIVAWLMAEKTRHHWLVFIGLYAAGIVLFFEAVYIHPALDFPQYIVNKQAEFNVLTGASKIELPPLQASFTSFARFFPYAVDVAFARPHIGDALNISYLPSILENGFILLMVVLWIFYHEPLRKVQPLMIFLLFFSFSVLLLCGYTVTFSGAVVRYKSIATPLFITALFVTINWQRLHSLILRKKIFY